MIALTVSHTVELSEPEASFVASMTRNPQFWSTSIGYGFKGVRTVRTRLRSLGLVEVSRRPVLYGAKGSPQPANPETYEHGEFTPLGLAVAEALRARAAAVEV